MVVTFRLQTAVLLHLHFTVNLEFISALPNHAVLRSSPQRRFPAYLWHEFSAVPAWGRNLLLWGHIWIYIFQSLTYTFSYPSVILMSHLKGIQLIIFLVTFDCMAAKSVPLWQSMSGGDWRVCRRCFIIFRLILAAVWIKFLLWVLACLWANSSNTLVIRKKWQHICVNK